VISSSQNFLYRFEKKYAQMERHMLFYNIIRLKMRRREKTKCRKTIGKL
jgi:hypothetical protein